MLFVRIQKKNTHEQDKLASRVRRYTRFHLEISLMDLINQIRLTNAERTVLLIADSSGVVFTKGKMKGNRSVTFLLSDNSHLGYSFRHSLFIIDNDSTKCDVCQGVGVKIITSEQERKRLHNCAGVLFLNHNGSLNQNLSTGYRILSWLILLW